MENTILFLIILTIGFLLYKKRSNKHKKNLLHHYNGLPLSHDQEEHLACELARLYRCVHLSPSLEEAQEVLEEAVGFRVSLGAQILSEERIDELRSIWSKEKQQALDHLDRLDPQESQEE